MKPLIPRSKTVGFIHTIVCNETTRKIKIHYSAKWAIVLFDNRTFQEVPEGNCLEFYFQRGIHTLTIVFGQLKRLDINSCNCTRLYFDNCNYLETLVCSHNKLKILDLTRCSSLKLLYCYDNQLSDLYLPKTDSLIETINCTNNKLLSVNLDNCNKLLSVDLQKNNLGPISVRNCTSLKMINLADNRITIHHFFDLIETLPELKHNSSGKIYCSISKEFVKVFTDILESKNWKYFLKPLNTK